MSILSDQRFASSEINSVIVSSGYRGLGDSTAFTGAGLDLLAVAVDFDEEELFLETGLGCGDWPTAKEQNASEATDRRARDSFITHLENQDFS